MKKKFLVLSLLLGAILFSTLAEAAEAKDSIRQAIIEESMVDQVIKKGTLRVGLSTFVPWAMKDKNGKLIGFEVDVATRLAKDMGVKVEFVPTAWDGIIMSLLTGQFDIIIGGMSMQPGRNLKVNFSIPYDYAGMDMVANVDNSKGFDKLSDFNKENIIIALRTGSTSEAAVKKYLPNVQIRYFEDEAQAVQEVVNQRANAMISSAPLPAQQAIKHPNILFTPLKENFTREPVGFAVRKGDPDSLNFLNTWITIVEEEGWLKERRNYWFRTTEWEKELK